MNSESSQSGGGADTGKESVSNKIPDSSSPKTRASSSSSRIREWISRLSLVAAIYFGCHLLYDWSKLKENGQLAFKFESNSGEPGYLLKLEKVDQAGVQDEAAVDTIGLAIIHQRAQLQNAIHNNMWGAGISICIFVLEIVTARSKSQLQNSTLKLKTTNT